MLQEREARVPISRKLGKGVIAVITALSKVEHVGFPSPIRPHEQLIPGKETKKQEKPR